MRYWFSADYHLGHANIIKYCNRPFKDVYHMNETIIRNHNARVKPDDVVFFLGDFCFRNTKGGKTGEGEQDVAEHYLGKLNGRFVFVKGNHDNNNSCKTILKTGVIELGGKEMFIVHDPGDMDPKFELTLHGHVHELWKIKKCKMSGKTLINVGVDVWKFMPISIEEIFKELEKWKRENQ